MEEKFSENGQLYLGRGFMSVRETVWAGLENDLRREAKEADLAFINLVDNIIEEDKHNGRRTGETG